MNPLATHGRNNLLPAQQPITIVTRNVITPEQAQNNLFSAIDFADENEFPSLCDAAISHGANVNTNNIFGRHPIVCAILRGSLPILRCLFARGALTPDPDQNGQDIVMIAAFKGHTDIVKFLITDGNMLNDAKNVHGITALHIATITKQTEVIKILLEYESCPNTLTSAMQNNVLRKIFDQTLSEFDIFKDGKNITPLMIATALKDYASVNLLINYEAIVDLGSVPPLLIAIKNNDAKMIKILSSAGAYSDLLPILNGTNLIEYAIKNKISTDCLQCLLKENINTIKLNSEQIYSLLAFSIKADRLDYLAILLATDISIEHENDYTKLYNLAINSPNDNYIFNLLAYLHASYFEQQITTKTLAPSFCELIKNFNHYTLTAIGVFPPASKKILAIFNTLRLQNILYTNEQLNFSLAIELGKTDLLNKSLFPYDFFNHDGENVATEWLAKVEEKANQQFKQLAEFSNEISDNKFLKYCEFLSLDFINTQIQSNKKANEISGFLTTEFTGKIGLPNDLAESFATVFRSAFRFTIPLKQKNYDPNEIASLTRKIIINLLRYKNFTSEGSRSEVSSVFLKKLSVILLNEENRLDSFYSSPFEFIKKLENRHNLRPPEVATLQKQLALHLGLPSQFCQYIVKAWSNSISKTNHLNNLTTLSAITQAHKDHFSLTLLDELETMSNYPDFFQEKFLEHTCQQLKNWCINQQKQTAMELGKRPSSNNYEPHAKRQRQQ